MDTTNTPVTEATPSGLTQAAIFAKEFAKGAAQRMLHALEIVHRNTHWTTKLAMGISIPHQLTFLVTLILPSLHFNSLLGITEAIGMILLVIGTPVLADIMIMSAVVILGQPAAASESKLVMIKSMVVPTIISGGINVLAPAPHWILRVAAGFIVFSIPVSEIMRTRGTKPDFVALEDMELGVEANLARRVDDLTVVATPAGSAVDQKKLNAQRVAAATKARELAKANPEMSAAMLMRATGCGRGAAKKALEIAKLEAEVAV